MIDRLGYKKAAVIKIKNRKPGRPALDRPKKSELQRLYVKEARSIRDIADILKCSKDRVYRSLKEYEIERRTNLARSRLLKYTLIELEKGITEKGIRGYARELGIAESALRHHLKIRQKELSSMD